MKAREMVKGKEEIWINNVLKEVKINKKRIMNKKREIETELDTLLK